MGGDAAAMLPGSSRQAPGFEEANGATALPLGRHHGITHSTARCARTPVHIRTHPYTVPTHEPRGTQPARTGTWQRRSYISPCNVQRSGTQCKGRPRRRKRSWMVGPGNSQQCKDRLSARPCSDEVPLLAAGVTPLITALQYRQRSIAMALLESRTT